MASMRMQRHEIKDNDWLEIYNRNGVVTARAVVSHRMPRGTMFMYHAQDNILKHQDHKLQTQRGVHIMRQHVFI